MERFGKFELLKRLGAGGMGEVFLAQSPERPEPVVLKRVLPQLLENPRFLRLFLDETRIAARLVHPNIARIFEIGEVDGAWYVTMEYVEGRDWREILKRARQQETKIPVQAAVYIGREIARALEYAHSLRDSAGKKLKIVHRDVSPHNVLISKSGETVKLIDFGVAKATNKSIHTATGILKGKFPYMAPEQANAKAVDARTDVFALGIVIWESIAGAFLFRGKSDAATLKKVRAGEVKSLAEFRDDVPRAVDRILRKALQKDPKDRYQTARGLAEAFDNALAGLPPVDLAAVYREMDDLDGLDDEGESELENRTEAESKADMETEEEGRSDDSLHVRKPRRATPVNFAEESSISRTKRVLSELAQRPTNLAPQPTSFVGRVAELADLQQLFRQGARLITLLGPGGTGKTRLSIQFASQLVSHFRTGLSADAHRGGVWFADLSDARDVDGICARLALALSVPLMPGNPVLQLSHVLAARGETLVVLDNFEQIVAHAQATVEAWMNAAPKVVFVATSRELLRVNGEYVFEVPPLRVPESSTPARASEAVQLFVERARVARPGWEPAPTDEAAIAEVVKQLDGMPLAIELAAARMGIMTPGQLVARLPRRFELLGSTRGAIERQATLRGAIDWSWRTLSQAEASMLAQCAVFRGGFSTEAAEAVVDLTDHDATNPVLETLMMLRSKSLIRGYFPHGDESEMRYGLYESIREYALEKLLASKEDVAAKERHARYFLELGAKISPVAESSADLLDVLELERDNLYAVFQRAVESGAVGTRGLLAVLTLDPLLTVRGPFNLHLQMLDASMKLLGPEPRPRAAAMESRARARQARGKLDEAIDDFHELLELSQQLKDRGLEGRAASYLATLDRLRGNRGDSRAHFEQALELLRKVKDRRMEGRTLSNFAVLLHEMSLEHEATTAYLQALEIHRATNDRRHEGITLANLGVLQQAQGLLSQARANYQDALAIHRELGNRRSEGISHINLGDLNRDLEQEGAAKNHYTSALSILREVGARRFEGIALVSLASLHQEHGAWVEARERYEEGVRLLIEVNDRRYGGLALAALASIDALEGYLQKAEASLATANAMLGETADASFLDALDLYRGHFELAAARRDANTPRGRAFEEKVEQRIKHAERGGTPNPRYPGGAPSPAERSEQVRAALRSLRTAIKRAPV